MTNSSRPSSPHRIMESIALAIGWTLLAMETLTASTLTTTGRCILIATG